jgi:pimeloyl-ACP methyl ester carboxylesterase
MKRSKKILTGALIALGLIYLLLIIIAYLPYKTTPIEDLVGEESKFIEVNGHTVHYTKQGVGKPLVLVHGFAGFTYTWRYLIPHLTDHYTVYALDVLGFGLSDKPPDGNYDMEPHGDFLIDFMDTLGIPSARLIGHSMGGIIIAYASIAAPEKVDAMVMIEPGFYNDPGPAFLNYLFFPLDRIMARQFYTRSMRERFFMGSFYNKSLVTDEVIDAYMLPTRTPNALEAMTQMMRTVGLKQYPGVTEKITRPTLLVWGERGPDDTLEIAKRINREVQGSQLASVQESGHYIQEEKAEELAQIIRDYLE